MNIEKELFPESGKLKFSDDGATALILDAELDPIKCNFNNDQCVELDVKDYGYITLSYENLEELIRMIEKVDLKYSI